MSSAGSPLSVSVLRFTGTYAGPGSNEVAGSFATHRSYESNAVHPTSIPRTRPAITNTGARENGLMFSFVRALGRGTFVADGGRAVISMIGGDGDGGFCDNGSGEAKDVVVVGGCDELLNANRGWASVSPSNGHQSNVVGEALD